MILKGRLHLSQKNDDYLVVGSGRSTNLSEMLNVMLFDDAKVKIRNSYDDKVLFDVRGQLLKQKVGKYFYLYHVGGQDIDTILWNFVGSKLEIELENVAKN